MSNRKKKAVALNVGTPGVLLVCLMAAVHSATTVVTPGQAPKVSVHAAADAPLQISAPTFSGDPRAPEVKYFVVNVGEKAVNAYAVRHVVTEGDRYSEGVVLRNGASANSLLNAGQSEPGALTGGIYPEPVTEIELALDFIEFADRTTWGDDKFKSAERLSGQRAGAKAEVERLLTLVEEKGIDAVVQTLKTDDARLAPPAGRTPQWNDGFREGVNFKRGRLKRAHSKSGKNGFENELRQPFDAVAEGRH